MRPACRGHCAGRRGGWGGGDRPLDLIAIDNLPSLLPAEASTAFSAALTPHLAALDLPEPPWTRARAAFRAACASVGLDPVPTGG